VHLEMGLRRTRTGRSWREPARGGGGCGATTTGCDAAGGGRPGGGWLARRAATHGGGVESGEREIAAGRVRPFFSFLLKRGVSLGALDRSGVDGPDFSRWGNPWVG
jgi:hypothetical protein